MERYKAANAKMATRIHPNITRIPPTLGQDEQKLHRYSEALYKRTALAGAWLCHLPAQSLYPNTVGEQGVRAPMTDLLWHSHCHVATLDILLGRQRCSATAPLTFTEPHRTLPATKML